MVRQIMGKAPHHTMGTMYVVGADGKRAAKGVKPTELAGGVTVACTYTTANGNPDIGFGRTRRVFGFGGGFGRGFYFCGVWRLASGVRRGVRTRGWGAESERVRGMGPTAVGGHPSA